MCAYNMQFEYKCAKIFIKNYKYAIICIDNVGFGEFLFRSSIQSFHKNYYNLVIEHTKNR